MWFHFGVHSYSGHSCFYSNHKSPKTVEKTRLCKNTPIKNQNLQTLKEKHFLSIFWDNLQGISKCQMSKLLTSLRVFFFSEYFFFNLGWFKVSLDHTTTYSLIFFFMCLEVKCLLCGNVMLLVLRFF